MYIPCMTDYFVTCAFFLQIRILIQIISVNGKSEFKVRV